MEAAEIRWKAKMNSLTPEERVRDLALYLLIWGEANQVRFTPECLCYIYKSATDYLNSPLCQQRQEPVPEGDYLNRVITPLYRFIRSQVYEIYDGRFVKREKTTTRSLVMMMSINCFGTQKVFPELFLKMEPDWLISLKKNVS